MEGLVRLLACAVLAFAAVAAPALAKVDAGSLGAAHFVGHWSMDGQEGCAGGDTLSFYESGAWAVTNGGGNPVEVLGTWSLGEGDLLLTMSELDSPAVAVAGRATVDGMEGDRMTMTIAFGDEGSESFTLDRCS